MMVLIQPGIYLIPYFVLLNNFGKKIKIKREHTCRKNETWRQTEWKRLWSQERGRLSRVFPCTNIYAAVAFSGFILCFSEQPRPYCDSLEGQIELKMEKKQICESDSWFWLPPTERVKTFIVSVDTWFLVIYCLLLLFLKLFGYFILKDECEKSLSCPLEQVHVLTYQ